jgi:hypothetical protein
MVVIDEQRTIKLDWQLLIVVLIVLAATVVVVRRIARWIQPGTSASSSCGGCSNCATPATPPVVTLESFDATPKS